MSPASSDPCPPSNIDNDTWAQPTFDRVTDDTHPIEGVKPLFSSFSAPRYPPLFLRNTLERPRDPDMVQPEAPRNKVATTTPQIEEDEPCREVLVPHNHPLYTHAQKKCEREHDADDESPHKRLKPQLTYRSNPLPKFFRYRPRLKPLEKTPKHKATPRTPMDPDSSDWKLIRTEATKPPPYDAILQHLAYRYRPEAKEPAFHPLPFPAGSSSAVHSFRKKYQPINMKIKP
ncbi:hypothetical protein EDB92DRAFT_1816946 [Lactarius akahatsu]|uniref:Uncharacterized protein n=1 Tax=Lactarius akahatsu TaxID=416441 RepID=A0AAD4QCS8_9AGAM|nr:hypothetical protein EDB92DRAFT_1816946 [Lactarius akahatsu]